MSTHRGHRKLRPPAPKAPPHTHVPASRQRQWQMSLRGEEQRLAFIDEQAQGRRRHLADLQQQRAQAAERDPEIERRIAEHERGLRELQNAANESEERCRRLRALLGEGGAS